MIKAPQRAPIYTMSKGNMLLGHAHGSVGSLVFYRANGKQIVRAKAEQTKNPQTQIQMMQRIIFITVAQAYSSMKQICDHSFEGVAVGAKSQAYFMKRNLEYLRNKVQQQIAGGFELYEIVAFTPLGQTFFAPNDYEVSKGTLPVVPVVTVADDSKMGFAAIANTYQGVIDTYGLQRGDQLTFVIVDGSQVGDQRFNYYRVILDPRDTNGSELPLSTAFAASGAIVSPSPRNEGTLASIEFADGKMKFSSAGTYLTAACIIVSRKSESGSWLRSNATLTANTDSVIGFASMQECLDAIDDKSIGALSRRYLNNAGTSVIPGSIIETKITTLTSRGATIARNGSVAMEAGPQDADLAVTGTATTLANGKTVAIVRNGVAITNALTVANGAFSGTLTASNEDTGSGMKLCLLDGTTIIDEYCTVTV